MFSFYEKGGEQEIAQEALLSSIEEFRKFATRNGVAIHLVYVPLTVEATFESVRQAGAKQNITLDQDASFRVAAWVAARLKIPLLDLRPVLQQTHSDGQMLVVKGDFHYSPVLSRACGERLWGDLAMPGQKNNAVTTNKTN